MVTIAPSRESVRALLDGVVDPEIPALTIAELGILRGVDVTEAGVVVTITPTYSGCPAMDFIRAEVRRVLAEAGIEGASVHTVFGPAWTTEDISATGRRKLAEAGIAPPGPWNEICCPRCASQATRVVSEFGSTACKALIACRSCGEPFHFFKEL
jgi:ring-1,2-phenylacetyl-CoA epoxidase subunit PaaD